MTEGLPFCPLTGRKAKPKNYPIVWIFPQIHMGRNDDNTEGISDDS